MMERIDVTPEFMESERVARFKDLKSSAHAFVDALIPGYERDIYNIIGRGVVEDKELKPPITDNRDFNVGLIKAEPGKGASLHIHETNEVFIPLTGKWGIYWQNSDGQRHEVVLEPYDTVSVPIGASGASATRATGRRSCSPWWAAPIRARFTGPRKRSRKGSATASASTKTATSCGSKKPDRESDSPLGRRRGMDCVKGWAAGPERATARRAEWRVAKRAERAPGD